MKFEEFNLHSRLLEALSYMGFKSATPIQEITIPKILEGKDVLACAQTGTGKTAAFLFPIIHKLTENPRHHINTLIIVPTRELAIQIDQQVQAFAYFSHLNSISIYGGGDGIEFSDQRKALTTGVEIVVATPGKLLSHLMLGYVKFDEIEHLILDEADRMLDMGFYDDIQNIISYLPKKRQTLLFSATMPKKIRKLAREILDDPVEINISLSKPAEGVLQAAYLVYDSQKVELIHTLIDEKPNYKSILIFSSTKAAVSDIVRSLRSNDYIVQGISSNLEQKEREEVLSKFRSRESRVLVATDVMSRGIDIKDIDLVINYDVPSNAEDYVHRVGRTARAESTGVALTLVNEKDMKKLKEIEELIGQEIMKLPPPSQLGEGPQWRESEKYRRNKKPHKKQYKQK